MRAILETLGYCLIGGFVIAGIRYTIFCVADYLRCRAARRRLRQGEPFYVIPGGLAEDVERRRWSTPPRVQVARREHLDGGAHPGAGRTPRGAA